MNTLQREIQALKMKQSRIEQNQKKENEAVWSRITTLEQLARENTGVDAGPLSQSVQISINKVASRRGWK